MSEYAPFLVANRKQHIAGNHAKPVTRVWEHESTPRSRNYIHMYKIKKRVNFLGFQIITKWYRDNYVKGRDATQ